MSFTEDELQSFNVILERRFQAHQREMERLLDRHMMEYRRETEQRQYAMQQEMARSLALKLADVETSVQTTLGEKLSALQTNLVKAFSGDDELAIMSNGHPMEAIEVQTELPWDDLMDIIGKAMHERLSVLSEELQRLEQNLEQLLSTRLYSLQTTLANITSSQLHSPSPGATSTPTEQRILAIEHLERVVESLQVVMTANHALLSDRLYSHQQLPVERAHPVRQMHSPLVSEETQAATSPDSVEPAEIASTNP